MQNNERNQAEVAGDSHVGQVRTNNEDRFAIAELDCGGERGILGLVADGVQRCLAPWRRPHRLAGWR